MTERGNELLQSRSIPEFLWPEAISHMVWIKNRSPTKSHKYKKTLFELYEGRKPNLAIERIWGSWTYVTLSYKVRLKHNNNKLTSPRGWLGYFMGFNAESLARVWSNVEKKVFTVSEPNVNNREGLDDPHNEQVMNVRVPLPKISEDPEE